MPYARSAPRRASCATISTACRGASASASNRRVTASRRSSGPARKGVPFYFCRVDMAGNITKRHSRHAAAVRALRRRVSVVDRPRGGGDPDRILVQHAETPDGVRYVSMAKGLVKPSGRFDRLARRYAVVLGARRRTPRISSMPTRSTAASAPTPIGISCRFCPRTDCDQRAFPPATGAIPVEPDVRRVVPYRVV